jgi:predicted RNase H-like HicB family nuclease
MDTRYHIEVEHNGEEWEVRFPRLPGCVGRGMDLFDAISAAEFAQDEYLGRFADAAQWGERFCG